MPVKLNPVITNGESLEIMPVLHNMRKQEQPSSEFPIPNSDFGNSKLRMLRNCIVSRTPLKPQNIVSSPFLFCVYHKDDYPVGNERMEAPRRGNGSDFNPNFPYRMYHGVKIPGFPQVITSLHYVIIHSQHPHRGFETITVALSGLVDHTDSMGNAGRYGNGDLQWMTAGNGIVHGENFPLINMDKPNPLRMFQLWLNLPKANKMVPPCFVMVCVVRSL